jgi:hypothetical protein
LTYTEEWAVVVEADGFLTPDTLVNLFRPRRNGDPITDSLPTCTLRDGVLRARFRVSAPDADQARRAVTRMLGGQRQPGFHIASVTSLDH